MKSEDGLFTTTILQTAAAFRLGHEAGANEDLIAIIDKLGKLLVAIPRETLADFATLMQVTFDAQKRQDHIGVADLLEYELLHKLQTAGLLID
ncbi:hypothetical protein Pcar_1144 [Syntrophotalea carbinolica DSM 2380]|uniref:Uncharacterized protein n=1 Tax=Syntrophotalea carbinolica (strain DSM 2380 / NBRC 103641 / GraBd1) TaxID=338963 RepID=Q3A5G4_SYNC1|nr:hypothetical protein [Syntrophotalea carbinolica]ABA88393.1 hypothetical protein Pcar_1144 [Syntrophotalea carbinolica DSM 2380]